MRIAAAESSLLWEKLASDEMPKGGPPLSAEEKGVIRAWINDGASSTDNAVDDDHVSNEIQGDHFSDHWAFRPPLRPKVPEVQHIEQVRNPIDAFIILA